MKKEGLILLLVFTLLSVLIFVESTATVEVYNITGFLNSTYPDAKIVGKINLSVSGIEKGINLSSNQGDYLDFYNFSKEQGYSIECFPEDCSNNYALFNSGSITKTIQLNEGDKVFLGLYIPDTTEEIDNLDSLNISITSDFGEENVCPLEINFFEGEFNWKFQEFSDNYSKEDYGFYDASEEDGYPSRISSSGKYCTLFDFEDLRELKAGANSSISGTAFVKMELYDSVRDSLSECYYEPSEGEDSCLLELDSDIIESSIAPYYVCVTSNTTTQHEIYKESSSTNKTGYYIGGEDFYIDDGIRNYAIFIQKAKYANATQINNSLFYGEYFEDDALSYLDYKYDYNCSEGCIIPLEISTGTDQNVTIKVNDFAYVNDEGIQTNKKIYLINQTKANLILSDVIDLSKTGFKIREEGEYNLNIGNEKILSEDVEFKDSYRITSFVPLDDIPANALTDYFVFTDGDSEDLTYYWEFSDNTSFETDTNHLQKIITEVGNYTVDIKVVDEDGVQGFNEFDLTVVSPTDEVVNKSFTSRKEILENFEDSLEDYSEKMKQSILDETNFSYYEDQLVKIEKDIEDGIKTNSEILNSLNILKIPMRVLISIYDSEYYPSADSIVTDLVAEKADENITSADLADYKEEILNWEKTYIQGQIISKEITIEDIYGEQKTIITEYIINAFSDYSDGNSYLVLDVPRTSISFNGSYSLDTVTGGTFIEFKNNIVNFYVLEKDYPEPNLFFTTDLAEYNINEIGECNNNDVCERSLGETSSNCSDCKKISLIVIWLIVISILGVIIFIGLRMWFKKNYEKKLFSNPRDLSNLMKFVNNAKRSGLSKSETKKELLEAGWSVDRINYAIKKTFKEEPVKKETPIKEPKKSRNINKSKKV